MRAPAYRWRTLPSNGKHEYAATEEEVKELAREQAQSLGTWVGWELWSEDHPQDDLNRGWAFCGRVEYEPHKED